MTYPTKVSGPGALSQRTDGGQPLRHIADAKYGEDKANIAQQKSAPLAQAPSMGPAGPPSGSAGPGGPAEVTPGGPAGGGPGPTGASAGQPITPFSAPSQNPDQHVTTGGMPVGAAPQAPGAPQVQPGQLSTALAPYFAADDTGILADFAWKLAEMGI